MYARARRVSYSSNIFAILGLRSLYVLVAKAVNDLPYLKVANELLKYRSPPRKGVYLLLARKWIGSAAASRPLFPLAPSTAETSQRALPPRALERRETWMLQFQKRARRREPKKRAEGSKPRAAAPPTQSRSDRSGRRGQRD